VRGVTAEEVAKVSIVGPGISQDVARPRARGYRASSGRSARRKPSGRYTSGLSSRGRGRRKDCPALAPDETGPKPRSGRSAPPVG